jgi:peptidoglycan hydrolase-like protein with peptidoglycan-binding domain
MVTRVQGSSASVSSSGQPLLREGASGAAVKTLQQKLNAAGFNCGTADGKFGPKTLAAVEAFQRSRGLTVDGVVGPATWGALSRVGSAPAPSSPTRPSTGTNSGSHPTLQLGSKGSAVVEMQRDLAAAGFSPGAADGQFGNNTLSALKRYQAAHGLTADGICGPNTWRALTSGSSFTPAPPPTSSSNPVLREGASGASVIKLQQLLQRAGISPGSIDGQFGPGTQSAVIRYQVSRGLSADGIVGPQTWSALESNKAPVSGTTGTGPVSSGNGTTRQQILQIAESQIGTTEGYNNDNPYSSYWGRNHESWCADFVSWVYSHAGVNMNNAWCPGIEAHLKSDGNWKGKSNPQPGDIVLFDWDGDGVPDHVGIVKGVNSNGTIETIEGNTGKPGGGPEGVWEKSRPMNEILGFGNLY